MTVPGVTGPAGLPAPPDDLFLHKMQAAFEGDPRVWLEVIRSLRDAMVDYAAGRVPFWRRTIRPGMPFEDIPVLSKELIRSHREDLMAEGVPPERRYLERTSGSSGEPLEFFRDRAQAVIENTSSERFFWRLWGIPWDATMVMITSRPYHVPRPAPWWRRLPGLRPPPIVHPTPLISVLPEQVADRVRPWSRFETYFLLGAASRVDWLADQIDRQGIPLPRRPVAVVTGGDGLTEAGRRRIGRVFGCPVHSRYATLETPYMAGTLPGTQRFAVNPFLAWVEVVDDDLRPVPPGRTGRILLTDLNNHVMPFIRYDPQDLGVPSPIGPAGGFRLLDRIEGRVSETLVLPTGRSISGVMIGHQLFKLHNFLPWIRFFQVAQTEPNALEIRVVWAARPDGRVRAELVGVLQDLAEPDTAITIREVEDLDRLASGKVWLARREFVAR
jgi:phenylacetate-CoA ligase